MFFFISPKNIYAFELSVKCCIISDHLFVCPHIVSHGYPLAFFKWTHEWAQNRPRLRTTLTKCSYKCTFKYMYLPHINPRTWIQSSIVYYNIFPVHHPLWYLASICIWLPQINNNDTNILVPLYQKQLEWNKIVTNVYACRPSNSWNVLKYRGTLEILAVCLMLVSLSSATLIYLFIENDSIDFELENHNPVNNLVIPNKIVHIINCNWLIIRNIYIHQEWWACSIYWIFYFHSFRLWLMIEFF